MWSVQIGRHLCFVLQRFSNFAQGLRPKVKAQQDPAFITTVFISFRFSSFTEILGIFNIFFLISQMSSWNKFPKYNKLEET